MTKTKDIKKTTNIHNINNLQGKKSPEAQMDKSDTGGCSEFRGCKDNTEVDRKGYKVDSAGSGVQGL